MVNSQREKLRFCILQKYIHCLKWVAHLFISLSFLEGKSHFTVIALQIFHLQNEFRAIAVVLLKSLNSCPWSAKERWRELLWYFPVAGSRPCRKGHKLENDDQGEQTGSGESRVPGAPSCLWDCQWVSFMTTFSLIECHILCCSGIGTIEGATKYFFSGQPSFTWWNA